MPAAYNRLHSPTKLSPYLNTLAGVEPANLALYRARLFPQHLRGLRIGVLRYGRGTETRTLIDRLKAGYSSVELYPQRFLVDRFT